MNAVAYVRVSTEEQGDSRAGLEAQNAAIAAAAASRNWMILHTFEEVASGSNLLRPQLEGARALARMEKCVLVVAKLDRLSRSLLDFAGIMAEAKLYGYQIVCLDLGVDTSTAAGAMMANVLATFAEFERRLISERTIAALAMKRAQGVRLGKARQIPPRQRQLIHALHSTGMSQRGIARFMTQSAVPTVGGKEWKHSTIRRVLSAPAVIADR